MRPTHLLRALPLVLLASACPLADEVDGGPSDLPEVLSLDVASSGRGPVALTATLASDASLLLELEFDSGAGFEPATLFEAVSWIAEPSAGEVAVRLIWDSFSDVDDDRSVELRLSMVDSGGRQPLDRTATLSVTNDPDNTRLVLAPKPIGEFPGGGISNVNTKVALLQLASDGTLSDSGNELEVGVGPEKAVFAPGRDLAVVLNGNGSDGNLSILDVDGLSATVRGAVLDLAPASIHDVAAAPDGEHLFAVAGAGTELNQLVEIDLADRLPAVTRSVDLASVSQCVAVSPRGDLVALGRHGGDDKILEIYDRSSLSVVGSLRFDAMLCGGLRFDASGRWLVSADEYGTNQITLIDVADPTAPLLADLVTDLTAAFQGIFHPDSTALAVSTLNGNSVVPYSISPDGQLSAGTEVSGGLPLAAEMDMIVRGQRRGLILVSALTLVVAVQLEADGSASKGATLDLGSGSENSVEGLAIAP